ncbi:MAG: prephenate dehydratase [Sandaracinaceae bacterium]
MSDDELGPLRAEIDGLDGSILELLGQRADCVKRVAEAKRRTGARTVDPEREKRVLERLVERGAGAFPASGIVAVFREIMSASVALQEPVTVSFLGPAGTWSHLAARTFFGFAAQYLEEASLEGVVDAVRKGRAEFGVVPLENSSEGPVHGALAALLEGGCQIRRELKLPVRHCLMGKVETLSAAERVYSHPQALAQCRTWIHQNLPRAQLVHTASTAAAVREAGLDAAGVAIGSPLAGQLAGLPVLREHVQDHRQNATRFVCIGSRDAEPTGADRTTVAFRMAADSEKGSLRAMLRAFDDHGVNLTRIESRPSPDQAWRYVFVVDLDGHRLDTPIAAALASLEGLCDQVQLLGSYPELRLDP